MALLYPTLEEALHLHARLIARFGGEPGVRDPGLLESALARSARRSRALARSAARAAVSAAPAALLA